MSTFYFVRHADKEAGEFYNPRLRHQDQPISLRGQQDARALWDFFSSRPVSVIYISGYLRTAQTAAYIADQLRLAPVVDERLNEIDNGVVEGLSDQELQQAYPETWQAFRERRADFRFPGGETGAEAQGRLVAFLEEKRMQHQGQDILVVSHDGLIRMLMCTILGLPVYRRWNFRIDLCGISEITYQPDYADWKLVRFNQSCR